MLTRILDKHGKNEDRIVINNGDTEIHVKSVEDAERLIKALDELHVKSVTITL